MLTLPVNCQLQSKSDPGHETFRFVFLFCHANLSGLEYHKAHQMQCDHLIACSLFLLHCTG